MGVVPKAEVRRIVQLGLSGEIKSAELVEAFKKIGINLYYDKYRRIIKEEGKSKQKKKKVKKKK